MKIDVRNIIRDHLDTLYNAKTGKRSYLDLAVFFGGPIAALLVAKALRIDLRDDVYNVSITFFGIFVALLLNIQVAIFGILQRKWDLPPDKRVAQLTEQKLQDRRALLRELNANLSYLILFCCLSLVAFLLLYLKESTCGWATAVAALLYTHFMLNLLMVIKRSHALFQNEYEGK